MAVQKTNRGSQNVEGREITIDRAESCEAQRDAPLSAFVERPSELECVPTRQDAAREILKAIDESKRSIQHHIDLRLLEMRIGYEKANADMLLRLGGVVLVIMIIAVASARFMGIIY
jgi:hypothetical protein